MSMNDREVDALLYEKLYNISISWRLCATDPDTGRWEDIQWHEEAHKPGDVVWMHPAALQPCYNWLDTDEPKKLGWTDDDITRERPGDMRWKVVPFYRTQIADAWQVAGYFLSQEGFHISLNAPGFYSDGNHWIRYEHWHCLIQEGANETAALFTHWGEGEGDTECEAICRAALGVFGVNDETHDNRSAPEVSE